MGPGFRVHTVWCMVLCALGVFWGPSIAHANPAAFRQAILALAETDQKRGGLAEISALDRENQIALQELPEPRASGGHVLSLGSGPDIFNPLYAFPQAEHLHLLDLGLGWAKGAKDVFAEIEARLAALAINGRVKRIRDGFLRYRPLPDLKEPARENLGRELIPGPWRLVVKQGQPTWAYYKHPVVWKVRWLVPGFGLQDLTVYLHIGDFNQDEVISNVLARINGPLEGVFLSGVAPPVIPQLERILNRMAPDALFLAYLFHTNSKGVMSVPESLPREHHLVNRLETQLTIPPPREVVEAQPRFYHGTLYVLKKRGDVCQDKLLANAES